MKNCWPLRVIYTAVRPLAESYFSLCIERLLPKTMPTAPFLQGLNTPLGHKVTKTVTALSPQYALSLYMRSLVRRKLPILRLGARVDGGQDCGVPACGRWIFLQQGNCITPWQPRPLVPSITEDRDTFTCREIKHTAVCRYKKTKKMVSRLRSSLGLPSFAACSLARSETCETKTNSRNRQLREGFNQEPKQTGLQYLSVKE